MAYEPIESDTSLVNHVIDENGDVVSFENNTIGYEDGSVDSADKIETQDGNTLTRSSSCPSLYETDEETEKHIEIVNTIQEEVRVLQRDRANSFSGGRHKKKTLKSKVLKMAGQFYSTSVYERMYQDSEDESDLNSAAEDYWDTTDWESDGETRVKYSPRSSVDQTGFDVRQPDDERQPLIKAKKITDTSAGNGKRKIVFTLFKAFVASGVLFLPSGYQKAGLVLGNVISLFVGVLSYIGMIMLLDAKDKLTGEGKKVHSYGDVGDRAFGKAGRLCVDIAVFFAQMGFCCAYFNFIGNNINSVIYLFSNCEKSGYYNYIILVMISVAVPMVWVRKLKHYAVTNIIADVLIVVPLFYILIVSAIQFGKREAGPPHEDTYHLFKFKTCLSYIGTSVYSMEGIAMIIPIESSARDKKAFRPLLKYTILLIVMIQMAFGSFCYLAYQEKTEAIITLNIGEPNKDNIIVQVIKICFSCALLFTLPLMIFPAVKITESKIFKRERKSGKKWQKNGIRTLLVGCCAAVAIGSGDAVDSLVAIIGGLFCVPLAFIFPALFHWKVCCKSPTSASWFCHNYYKLTRAKIYDSLLFGLGALCALFSTVMAIMEWVNKGAAVQEPCQKI